MPRCGVFRFEYLHPLDLLLRLVWDRQVVAAVIGQAHVFLIGIAHHRSTTLAQLAVHSGDYSLVVCSRCIFKDLFKEAG